MVRHLFRLAEKIPVLVRLKNLVDAQDVVRQEQPRIQRLLACSPDVGPQDQQLFEWKSGQIQQLSDCDQLVDESCGDILRSGRDVGTVAITRAIPAAAVTR